MAGRFAGRSSPSTPPRDPACNHRGGSDEMWQDRFWIENLERRRSPKQKTPENKPDVTPQDRWASPEDESTIPLRRSHHEHQSPSPSSNIVWVDTALDWSKTFDKTQAPPEDLKTTKLVPATANLDLEILDAVQTAFENTEPKESLRKPAVSVLDQLWESVGQSWSAQDDTISGAFGRLRRSQAENQEISVDELKEFLTDHLLPDRAPVTGPSPVPFNAQLSPMATTPAVAHSRPVRSPVTPFVVACATSER